ncbi:MAG TPA: hypothetical protein VH144_03115 [Candidatus Saccharimonadales bacterium]|jgi:hypothetical protein|nr:hypothetical protein [Candidatus Saccharimonadales bacterium]
MAKVHPIVGVWYVHITGAPFAYHLLTFHSDGTLTQANPDAGDATTSDSIGMGPWQAEGDGVIRAKFVETTADRTTHEFVARGEISFELTCKAHTLEGTAEARFYDLKGRQVKGPSHHLVQGQRIKL